MCANTNHIPLRTNIQNNEIKNRNAESFAAPIREQTQQLVFVYKCKKGVTCSGLGNLSLGVFNLCCELVLELLWNLNFTVLGHSILKLTVHLQLLLQKKPSVNNLIVIECLKA